MSAKLNRGGERSRSRIRHRASTTLAQRHRSEPSSLARSSERDVGHELREVAPCCRPPQCRAAGRSSEDVE
eukprot:12855340-Alexandrium_andersonii.AAC.1